MKIIINAASLSATGATQVSVSFINECILHSDNEYHVFISNTVSSQIDLKSFPPNFKFYLFEGTPYSFSNGFSIIKQLKKLEIKINPDCVFTVFGPSVWTPNAPHLMGYAYPYYVYPESPFFNIISKKLKIKISIYKFIHRYFLNRNGKYYVCESEDVSSRLPAYLGTGNNQIFTVTNTCNNYFNDFKPTGKILLPQKKQNEFRFVTLSSFARHKNLSILNAVIPILKRKLPEINFKFVLTVDQNLFKTRFTEEAQAHIYNLGRIKVSDCPQVYYESDALFLPTLMECFSASYPEAMKMGKPIITSDLPFATTVCDTAAIYFDPIDANDIADKILRLVQEQPLREDLILKGYERLLTFDTAEMRATKYLEICKKISTPKQ